MSSTMSIYIELLQEKRSEREILTTANETRERSADSETEDMYISNNISDIDNVP